MLIDLPSCLALAPSTHPTSDGRGKAALRLTFRASDQTNGELHQRRGAGAGHVRRGHKGHKQRGGRGLAAAGGPRLLLQGITAGRWSFTPPDKPCRAWAHTLAPPVSLLQTGHVVAIKKIRIGEKGEVRMPASLLQLRQCPAPPPAAAAGPPMPAACCSAAGRQRDCAARSQVPARVQQPARCAPAGRVPPEARHQPGAYHPASQREELSGQ